MLKKSLPLDRFIYKRCYEKNIIGKEKKRLIRVIRTGKKIPKFVNGIIECSNFGKGWCCVKDNTGYCCNK